MKLIHKLFHRMMNRSCKLQGCSLIYVGMANYLDVPVLSLTVGSLCCVNLKNMCLEQVMTDVSVYTTIYNWGSCTLNFAYKNHTSSTS